MSVALRKTLPPSDVQLPPEQTHRFTVAEYLHMIDAGVLARSDRMELLEGWIVDKMTRKPSHDAAVDLAQELLRGLLPAPWHVREEKSITTASSVPEPDLVVVRGPARRYAKRHPNPQDVALVVEVSDTTLFDDRDRKGRIYAGARIPIYWIVNLIEEKIEVYTQPKGGKTPTYRQRQDFGPADRVPVMIAGKEIGKIVVKDLLP